MATSRNLPDQPINMQLVNKSRYFANIATALPDVVPFQQTNYTAQQLYKRLLRVNISLRKRIQITDSLTTSVIKNQQQTIPYSTTSTTTNNHPRSNIASSPSSKLPVLNNSESTLFSRLLTQKKYEPQYESQRLEYRLPTFTENSKFQNREELTKSLLSPFRRMVTDINSIEQAAGADEDGIVNKYRHIPRTIHQLKPNKLTDSISSTKEAVSAVIASVDSRKKKESLHKSVLKIFKEHTRSTSVENRETMTMKKLLLDKPIQYDQIVHTDTSSFMIQSNSGLNNSVIHTIESPSNNKNANCDRKYWNLKILKAIKASKQQQREAQQNKSNNPNDLQANKSQRRKKQFLVKMPQQPVVPDPVQAAFEKGDSQIYQENELKKELLPSIRIQKRYGSNKMQEPTYAKKEEKYMKNVKSHMSEKILAQCKGIKKLMRLGVYR